MSRTILVVDDDAVIRGLVAELLEQEGFDVESASDGLDALAVLERIAAPDLIVSDVVMPRLGGVGLHQAVRGGGHQIPFILMSAIGKPQPAEDAFFIAKPFDVDRLLEAVHFIVKGRGPSDA